ncbi:hypothetical protein Z945_2830 [Sulfitobacter noctilucae]|uniref:hypothetical protein n=1 Tax=Sulfitobacter noctilucae TaxID=1342302 RepID=UPI000A77872D|nr:hypothetical protein [Sulfitobacter noctilucae]KIN74932.1 hypothetical protein Z945_2830 [Sulfitobacter noctilucae]
MAQGKTPPTQKTEAQLREDRLKAALKSNMARRKAQSRVRSAQVDDKNKGQNSSDEESR